MGCTRIPALAALVVAAGCAARPTMFGEAIPPGCSGDAPAPSDRCTGWILDRLMMTTAYHAYSDPALAAYVQAIGDRIARATGDRATWTFRVLDDPTPQAFVNLGRVVYVHRGAIAMVRDEAELAALLAHEIAHLLAHHHLEREIAYQRDDEIQADELAVKFLAAAGYDPGAVERMLRALGAITPDAGASETSNHPGWAERIAMVQATAIHYPATGARNADALRPYLARLVVGWDPHRTAVLGHAVVFDRVGIAVDVTGHIAADGAVDVDLGSFEDAGETRVQLRIVPTQIASSYLDDHAIAAELYRAGTSTLVVIGAGSDAAARVHAIAASVRPIRTDERARIHPTLLDLAKPRPLWSAPATASRR